MANKMGLFLVIIVSGMISIGIYLMLSTEIMDKLKWKRIRSNVQINGKKSSRNTGKINGILISTRIIEDTLITTTVQNQEYITPTTTIQRKENISPTTTIQRKENISPTTTIQRKENIRTTTKVQIKENISPSTTVQDKGHSLTSTVVQSKGNISSSNYSKKQNKETLGERSHDSSSSGVPFKNNTFLTDEFLQNNRDGSYPSRLPCPYIGLRKAAKNPVASQSPLACAPHRPSAKSCEDANSYFGRPDQPLEERKCDETSYQDICTFTQMPNKKHELNCDAKVCGGNEVTVGSIDPSVGVITKWEAIKPFSTSEVRKYVNKKIEEKHAFCFLKCGGILQALIYPPKILTNKNIKPENKININIVVLDSISRPHFFRVMRESVAAMRKVIYDESINATILDYELFQSISMHTFGNIRSLFSGVIQGNDDFSSASVSTKPLGIKDITTAFKKHGYQTMFQEDLCWHDSWGIMLNNIQAASGAVNQQTWQTFQNIVKEHNLDHIGITHFSCEVVKKYGLTNHYDRPPKVCLNGKFYNAYFLEYLEKIFKELRETEDSAPMFLYQHFNSGHTDTGSRIRNDEKGLVEFIHNMARDPNTLTILMADHGHTRTGYGVTDEGRHELYHPLLFMILPYHVADMLGKQRTEALVHNQHRLLSAYDLHTALMSLHDQNKKFSVDYKVNGVFSKIPANRTCSDVPLMPLARCQCEGADSKVQDNSNAHRWLAEFGLGSLNNIIQEQFSKGLEKNSVHKGYGNCLRLIGSSFRNIIQSNSGSLTRLDLHVDSKTFGLKEDEIYTVAIELNGETPTLKSYVRRTLYNKFKDCVDKNVDIKICACDKTKPKSDQALRVLKTEDMKSMVSSSMFGTKAQVKDLHGGCLFQITRHHPSKISIAYEVANSCPGQTFKVSVSGSLFYVLSSRPFPFEVTVEPNSIYFLFSAGRQILGHSHMDITISARKV